MDGAEAECILECRDVVNVDGDDRIHANSFDEGRKAVQRQGIAPAHAPILAGEGHVGNKSRNPACTAVTQRCQEQQEPRELVADAESRSSVQACHHENVLAANTDERALLKLAIGKCPLFMW